jgi:hypothetical protein
MSGMKGASHFETENMRGLCAKEPNEKTIPRAALPEHCCGCSRKLRDELIVYGANLHNGFRSAWRIAYSRGIERFCESKYVGEFNGLRFSSMQQICLKKELLFTGTPCQIYA